jgi:phosphate-selective porin OprO/OprP
MIKQLVAGIFAATLSMSVYADSTVDIVDALVSKGVLTEEEGKLITKGRAGETSAKDKQMTAKFKDGVTFSDANGDNSLSIGGRIHTDYRNFSHNQPNDVANIPTNSANETDTFDMRRARIEVKGKFAGNYEFLLSTDLAGASAGNTTSYLDQAYLNYTYTKPLQFRVGQFKMPMNLEKITSSNNTDFMERALVNQLVANEDRGIMAHGALPGYTYALAISNGEGAKNRNDADPRVDSVEYVGRGTVNFAEIMGDKNSVYHLGVSGSWTNLSKGTANGYLSGTSSVRTEARGINIFTMPTITAVNGVDNSIERTRVGLEGAMAYGPVKLQSEYIRNTFKGDTSTTARFNNNIDAWYAEALWLVTGETYADSYKEGAWSTIKPKNNFEFGKGTGAVEVGARYSKFDASDWAGFSGLNMANNTLKADSWTGGVKWILNPNTKLMLNYVRTSFDTPITVGTSQLETEKAVMARVQWNF